MKFKVTSLLNYSYSDLSEHYPILKKYGFEFELDDGFGKAGIIIGTNYIYLHSLEELIDLIKNAECTVLISSDNEISDVKYKHDIILLTACN